MSIRRALTLNGIWIAILLTGCDRGPHVEFGEVKGTVRVNGKPKRGLLLRCSPDPQKGNGIPAFASGTTDDQGIYTLHWEYQGKEGTGAPVGWNRISVIDTTVGHAPQGVEPKPSSIPMIYGSPTTTPLVKEVKTGEQTIDLDITR